MQRAILTGLGGRGMYWLGELQSHAGVEVVAAVEPAEANRQRAIEKRGLDAGIVFESLDDAIKADTGATFVMDVTPPAVHDQIAYKAFDAGLHVLGEKPLTDDPTKAAPLVEAGRKAGVRHMIAQNYRFDSSARQMQRSIAEGLIGKPGQCDVQFYMPWADIPGSHYVTQPYMLINDMMVHHFDLMRLVLGSDPTAVTAITWNQPWGWHEGDAAHAIVFEFPDGLRATHVSIGCSVGEHADYYGTWRVEGPQGSLKWENRRIWHTHLHRAEKKVREEVFSSRADERAHGILNEFIASIDEGRDPECSAEDNLKSVAMVFAAIKSAKEGRRVELAETT